jgi:enoyl-CoA hydratase
LREARRLGALEPCLAMELRAAKACLAGHDLPEGIRAAIVDKDRNPRWSPDRLEDVTPDMVDRHFRSLGPDELDLPAADAAPGRHA